MLNRNITCQSGVDIILNNSNLKHRNSMNNKSKMEEYGMMHESSEYEDKKFIDMVTSKENFSFLFSAQLIIFFRSRI